MGLKSKLFAFFIISLFVLSTSVKAQQLEKVDYNKLSNDSILNLLTDIELQIKKYSRENVRGGLVIKNTIDSLLDLHTILTNIHAAKRDDEGLIIYPRRFIPLDESLTFRDTIIFEPALLPAIFDGQILPSDIDFLPIDSSKLSYPKPYRLIDEEDTFTPDLQKIKQVNKNRRAYYVANLDKVKIDATHFSGEAVLKKEVVENKSPWKDLLSPEDPIVASAPEIGKIKIKQVHWKTAGIHDITLSQRQVSDNWNGGGDNAFALNNKHEAQLNYKRNKITWENKINWNLDILKTPSDTTSRAFNVAEDEFKIYSNLGLQSFIKRWNYSISFEAKTPFFNGYNQNDTIRLRSFMSPLELNLGIGTTYKLERVSKHDKTKKLNLNVTINPLSVKYVYVRDNMVESTRYGGIEEGKNSRTTIGSNIYANFSYAFNRYTLYTNEAKFDTDYESTFIESKNRFSFLFNRFLTASIDLNIRFDDKPGADKKGDWGYCQYNERLALGVKFLW